MMAIVKTTRGRWLRTAASVAMLALAAAPAWS